MSTKSHLIFLHGEDSYRLARAKQAIETRFRTQQNSMADLVTFDMSETSLETVRQTLLTMPFFVSYRLFILKHTFQAPKATQEGLVALLPQVSDSTVIVFYEPTGVDKRVALFKWLSEHARTQTYPLPTEPELQRWIDDLAREQDVTFDATACQRLLQMLKHDTWQLANEVKKLACYVLSQKKTVVTGDDVALLCQQSPEESVFELTNALRDGNLVRAMTRYRTIRQHDDPLMIAGAIAGQLRAWAKIFLAKQADTSPPEIARVTQLNPYVVKLSLSVVSRMSLTELKRSYQALVTCDTNIKNGSVPPDLSVSLLLITLSKTM